MTSSSRLREPINNDAYSSMPPSMMPVKFDANATSAVGPVPLHEPAKTMFASKTGNNGQAEDVRGRQRCRAHVHQRPLVGRGCWRRRIVITRRVVVCQYARANQRQQDGIGIFVELWRGRADFAIRQLEIGPLRQQR